MTDIAPDAPAAQQRSHLSRKWTLKIGVIALALLALGVWGLYDAMIRYPARGSEAAEYFEYQYLQSLVSDHREYQASVADPISKLADLEQKENAGQSPSPADRALHGWLDQLRIIGKLQPTSTQIPRIDFRLDDHGLPIRVDDVGQRYNALKSTWSTSATKTAPPPLSRWDILMQWLIVAAGAGGGIWLLILIAAARSKVYRWDPASQKLTLPGGPSIVPDDIAEFDKRKWHKLFINLKIKPSHPQLGGKDIEIDLLRFEPVEEWVLAMEKTVSPQPADEPPEPAQPSPAAESPAPQSP